jgi:peptide/nickel transport system ATP-binding protein
MLDVAHLTTVFDLPSGPAPAVHDVSFHVAPGETLGLVGESGSGKSVTAMSIMRLVQPPGRIAGGTICFKGRELLTLPEEEMRRLRGAEIALIFQEPMSALNPVFTIGDHLVETLVVHGRATKTVAKARAIELLDAVRIPNPAARVRDYPHQLSGGQRQRVLIAMAVACNPSLIIADEPTTALDVTIQAQILDLLREMKGVYKLSLLLITHDLGVVAETADRVAVMYAGRIVEHGPVRALLSAPQHPYTQGLIASLPGRSRKTISPASSLERSAQAPGPDRRLRTIEGSVPMLNALPPGCAFHPRCPERFEPCAREVPTESAIDPSHGVMCHLHSAAHATR